MERFKKNRAAWLMEERINTKIQWSDTLIYELHESRIFAYFFYTTMPPAPRTVPDTVATQT